MAALHLQPRATRVLVADDHPAMRELLVAALERKGFEVTSVGDGHALWQRIHSLEAGTPFHTDLIISDIRMPRCSGLAVLEMLRDKHWQVPVILMTAFGDAQTRTQALMLGARLVDKPFKLPVLMDEVDRVLSR